MVLNCWVKEQLPIIKMKLGASSNKTGPFSFPHSTAEEEEETRSPLMGLIARRMGK